VPPVGRPCAVAHRRGGGGISSTLGPRDSDHGAPRSVRTRGELELSGAPEIRRHRDEVCSVTPVESPEVEGWPWPFPYGENWRAPLTCVLSADVGCLLRAPTRPFRLPQRGARERRCSPSIWVISATSEPAGERSSRSPAAALSVSSP
jgi:hypothetical protein